MAAALGSEEYHDLGCDPCSGNGTSRPAVKYCQVCDELLCQNCVTGHLRNKVLKTHPLNDNLSASFKRKGIHPLALCDKHRTERVEQYCETHSVLCCEKCRVVTHKKCKVSLIKNKSQTENQSKLVRDSLKRIKALQQNVQRIKANQENGIKSLTINKDRCFTEVKALKKELDDLFVKLAKEAIDEIVQTEASIKAQIDDHIAESERLLQQLNDCKNMLEDCESTKDDELMFIGVDRYKDDIDKMIKLVAELQNSIISPDMQFEAQQDVKNMRKTLKRLGNVKSGQLIGHTAKDEGATSRVPCVNVTPQRKSDDKSVTSSGTTRQSTDRKYTSNVLGATVLSERALDVKSDFISGSIFLESGELVLCDQTNRKLLLFSQDLTLKGELQLSGRPWDVAAITERRVAVTTPDDDQLIFVDTTPTMSVTNTIKLTYGMCGIVSRSQLYVLVRGGGGGGQRDILVVSHDGRQVRTINLLAVGIKNPHYIAVNRDESRVFVSDGYHGGTNSVWCLDCQSGTELFRYHSKELNNPQGLFVDDNNVLMICWWESHEITVVTAEGRHERTRLSDTDGLYYPQTVTYRPRDGTLVVGMDSYTSPACLVFRLKSK